MQPQAKMHSPGGLHDVLMRVAPQKQGRPKEVMIAISNYNLWPLGALPLWVKVRPLHLCDPMLQNCALGSAHQL